MDIVRFPQLSDIGNATIFILFRFSIEWLQHNPTTVCTIPSGGRGSIKIAKKVACKCLLSVWVSVLKYILRMASQLQQLLIFTYAKSITVPNEISFVFRLIISFPLYGLFFNFPLYIFHSFRVLLAIFLLPHLNFRLSLLCCYSSSPAVSNVISFFSFRAHQVIKYSAYQSDSQVAKQF